MSSTLIVSGKYWGIIVLKDYYRIACDSPGLIRKKKEYTIFMGLPTTMLAIHKIGTSDWNCWRLGESWVCRMK